MRSKWWPGTREAVRAEDRGFIKISNMPEKSPDIQLITVIDDEIHDPSRFRTAVTAGKVKGNEEIGPFFSLASMSQIVSRITGISCSLMLDREAGGLAARIIRDEDFTLENEQKVARALELLRKAVRNGPST
jgi:hypothetical protein